MSNDMVKNRIEEEKKVVKQMIFLYCLKKEGNGKPMSGLPRVVDIRKGQT